MANRRVQSTRGASKQTVRASISFAKAQYAGIERLAKSKRVSVAWVVREAIDAYLKSNEGDGAQ